MSGSRGVDARLALSRGWSALVVLSLVIGGGAEANGQGFEVPEPPGLDLPDLPVPSPSIGATEDEVPDFTPIPTQRRTLPEPPRVGPPGDEGEEVVEPPSRTVGALIEDFEGDRVSLVVEASEAPVQMKLHDRTGENAFDGLSERFRFVAGFGSGVYVSYPLPRVPLSEELTATIYVNSNRPGVQVMGRVVLPNDIDPDNGQAFFINVGGAIYEESGRWRRLELRDIPSAVERQARILRIKTNEKVQLEGAYLDRIVLNLYGGAGDTEVLVDALRISPVEPELLADRPRGRVDFGDDEDGPGPSAPGDAAAGGRIRFNRNRLELLDGPERAYFPWLPTIIDAPGASPEGLRHHGFDILAVRPGTPVEEIEEAAGSGMLLMPMLGDPEYGPADSAALLDAIGTFPERESVAFWHLGEGLGAEALWQDRQATLKRVREAVDAAGGSGEGVSTLTTGDVAGDHALYSSRPGRIDLIGAHGTPWGSVTQPLHYYNYLTQRRDLTGLSNVEALFWTWIPASAPPELQWAIYGSDPPPAWGRPQVLPEQIRLATAAALSAGYRAIGFRGDAELARESGRARMIELDLINAEIDLFQEILARNVGTIHHYKASPPPRTEVGRPINQNYNERRNLQPEKETPRFAEIQAVGFTTPDRKGTLLLVSNLDWNAQWIPGQIAEKEIRVTVPGHTNVSAWEITMGGIRHIERERVPGGIELRIPDFGASSWILLTPNTDLVRRLEQNVATWSTTAAELAIEQAELRRQAVVETHSQLVLDGLDVKGSDLWLAAADDQLQAARAGIARGEASKAFANARRVVRPLQLLMKAHGDRALEDLTDATEFVHDPDVPLLISPVSAPPLICFNTLPQLELFWISTIRNYPFGQNLLPSGEFEEDDPEAYVEEGWSSASYEVPGLQGTIDIEPDDGRNVRGSRRLLRLRVRPAEEEDLDALPPVQDRPTVAIESPPIPVRRHEFLRISVLVKMPMFQAPGSGGGVIVRDSIGGELMQFRDFSGLPEWRRVVLYRRVPEDMDLTVTLGLAATSGEVVFDDLRIERAEQPGTTAPSIAPALGALPAPTERIEPAPEPTGVPMTDPGGRTAVGSAIPPRRE